jgi:flagellar biosynthesis GTPase FlhF
LIRQFTSLARKGFSKDTIDKYLALSSDTKNSESFSEYLHCSLDNSSEFFRPDTDRVVYVCGPSGSGKTSSLIRLATYAKMSGLKTGVFILERHSTKSSEALKLAGRVLDMPVIHLPKDCAFERIESLVRVGATLFIDSESMLEKNLRLISLLQNIFRSDSDVKIFTALAIPSNYSGNTLQAFADQNSTLLDRIILTKTDEATPDPELLSAMIRYRMGIVSVSNSLHFFDSFAFLSPEIIDTWIHENTTNILT